MVKFLTKHRDEREQFRISFRMDMAKEEKISSVEEIGVRHFGQDVTAEFEDPTPPTFGEKTVVFWLRAAAEDEQVEGQYQVYLRVITSIGREIVAQGRDRELPPLFVTE